MDSVTYDNKVNIDVDGLKYTMDGGADGHTLNSSVDEIIHNIIDFKASELLIHNIDGDLWSFQFNINREGLNISDKLKELCPEGVNVYFDNVAGSTLDAVLENMTNFGVIAVCGLLENYASTERLPGPYNYDLILMKRLRFEGFFSPDFYHREAEINPILKNWDKSGLLRLPIEVTDGLENLVSAYSKLFEGSNIGKVVVKV